jgi:hypothetical protein
LVIAAGEDAGEGWELFIYDFGNGPVLGHVFETQGWGWSEPPDMVDPCSIESARIPWIYLSHAEGWEAASPPDHVVVLQFHVIPPETGRVMFHLSDGRVVDADVFRVPDDRAPWDVFALVFDGPAGIGVDEVAIEDTSGNRLDDPAVC